MHLDERFVAPVARRISWGTTMDALVDVGDRTKPSWEYFHWKPYQFVRLLGKNDQGQAIHQEGTGWHLYLSNEMFEQFSSEVDVKVRLIRWVYSLKDAFLVPSELLVEAKLQYASGMWVDIWNRENHKDVIVEIPEGSTIEVSPDRKIKLESEASWKARLGEAVSRRNRAEVVASALSGVRSLRADYRKPEPPKELTEEDFFRPVSMNWEDPSPWSRVKGTDMFKSVSKK